MELDRDRTALLLMDLQHDIVSPDGKFGSHGLAQQVLDAGAVTGAARALAAARATRTAIVHVGVVLSEGEAVNTSAALMASIVELGALRAGSDGAQFVGEVAPAPGELVVTKSVVSALSGTPLDHHLRNRGITHLVLTGVATNMVVEGTTRHAVDSGYRVTILRDACASFSPELHEFALTVLSNICSISSVDEFVAAVGRT